MDQFNGGRSLRHAGIIPGDVIAFQPAPAERWLVTRTDFGDLIAIEAVPVFIRPANARTPRLPAAAGNSFTGDSAGVPDFELLDLPMQPGRTAAEQFRIAAWSSPPRTQAVYMSPDLSGFEHRTDVLSNAVIGNLTMPLAGAQSGRFDHANAIELSVSGGAFESVTPEQLYAGRNAVAVRAQSDAWEIVQFLTAEEIAAGQWRLTGLLRGQGGTEDAMQSGAVAGARVVLLDASVVPAGLKSYEAGLSRQFRIGVSGRPFTDRYFETVAATGGVRALLPLSPVHLSAGGTPSGGIAIGGIRRTRIDGDSWLGTDVPLGEEDERYAVRIYDGSDAVWEGEAAEPALTLDALETAALGLDLPGAALDLSVAQISRAAGEGIPARKTIIIS